MRKGGILGLTWDKVNLNTRRIQLEAIDNKTGELRTCPIINGLYEMLLHKAKERRHIKQAGSSNYVILYNGQPVKEIRTAIKTAHRRGMLTPFSL